MGYKLEDNMKVGLVKDALTMAIKNCEQQSSKHHPPQRQGHPVLLSRLFKIFNRQGDDIKHNRKI